MTQDISPAVAFIVLFCLAGMVALAMFYASITARNEQERENDFFDSNDKEAD